MRLDRHLQTGKGFVRVVCSLVELIRAARVSVKGGHIGSCKDTFSKCLKEGDTIHEDDQCHIQGIIPDMVIDAHGRINKRTMTTLWMIG